MQDFPPLIFIYLIFVTALLGLVMGSFCNAWAWRIANGEKISRGRSHCTSCGHVLGAKDLVPLFSWLFLKGKCRYCGAKIPFRYPLTELISMAYYLTVVLSCGLSLTTLRLLVLGSLLLVSSLTDWDTMELPDGLTAAMAAAAFLRFAEGGDAGKTAVSMLCGAAAAFGVLLISLVMDKALKRESMGGGDIKLLGALGLHFGAASMLYLIICACLAGLVFAAAAKKKDRAFPFGPMIAAGAWLTAVTAGPVINAYLSLF